MILDTNVVIQHIRKQIPISSRAVLPIVVVGELEAFALKSDWSYQKMVSLNAILEKIPIADIDREITQIYAKVDAYSQGRLKSQNRFHLECPQEIWVKMIYGLRQFLYILILNCIVLIMILTI